MRAKKLPGFPPNGWELQGQRLDGDDVSDSYIRDASIFVASQCIGLSPRDPLYYDALYPWDIEVHRVGMAAKQYKCGLTVLMLLRALGFALPEDGKGLAWRFGHCPQGERPPADPITQIQMLSGWRSENRLPEPGDAMIIGRKGDPRATHALIVLEYNTSGGEEKLTSLDGGSGAVKKKKRDIVYTNGKIGLHDNLGVRAVLGTVNITKMRGSIVREYCIPGDR